MQFVTSTPYSRADAPNTAGESSWAAWATKLVAYLKKELANVQRGSARAMSRTVTAATTANTDDGLILADATGGAFAVTLPAPATVPDMCVTIKRLNGGANAVTVGGTTDGTLNRTLAAQYASVTVWAHAPRGGTATWNIVADV